MRIATLEDAPRIAVLGAQVWLQTYATAGVSDVIARYVLETFAVRYEARECRDGREKLTDRAAAPRRLLIISVNERPLVSPSR